MPNERLRLALTVVTILVNEVWYRHRGDGNEEVCADNVSTLCFEFICGKLRQESARSDCLQQW